MTEPEHPIYIDQFWQGSHHYFDESNVDYFERRPEDGFNVWLETDLIPSIPPAQSAYPGTPSLEASGVSGLALTNGVGDGKTFTSAIPGALLNLIPANYNDGVYQFRLFDANGTEVPYNPDVWVADGIREAIYFKEGVPSGFAAPFTFDYWQYTGATAGTSVISGGTNLGGGAEVFKDVIAPNMRFRTLIGGGNITVSETGFDTIRIQDVGGSNINDLELYVAQNGNDANDGSLASPFLTLGRAFDEVEAKGWNDTAEIRILNTGGPLVMPPVLNLSTGTRGKQRQPLIIRGWGTGVGGATTPGVDLVKGGVVDAVLVDTDGSQILTITSAGTFVASDTSNRIRFTSGPMTTYVPEISGFTFSEVTTVVETFAKFVDADNVQLTYADTTLPIVGDSFDVLQNNTTISLAGDTAWTTDGSTIVLEDLNIEASYVGNNSRFNILGNSEIRFRGVVISDTGAVIDTTVFELNNFDGTTLIGGIEAIDEDATAPGVVPNTKSIAFIGSASSTFRLGTNLEPSVRGKTAYSNLLATSLVPSLITLSAATYLGQSIAGFLTSDVYAGTTIDRTIGSLIGLVRRLEGGPGSLGSVSSSSVVNISNIHMVSAIGGLSITGPVKAYISGKCLIDGTGPLAVGEGVIDVINGAELVVDATLFEVAVSNADEIKYRISDSTLKILNVGAATDVFSSGGTVFDATDSELVFGPDVFSGAIVEAGINAGNTCFNLKNSQANLSPAVATLNTSGTVGIAMTSSTFDAAGYSLNLGQVGDGHTQALTMDMGSTLNAENITVTDMSGDVVVSRSTLNVAIALSFIAPNTSSSTNQMSVRWSSKVSVDTFSSTTAPVNVLGITDGSSFNVLQTMTINGVAVAITGEAVFCERKSKLTVGGNFSFTQPANANVVRISDGSEMDVGDDFTVSSAINIGGIPLLVETGSRATVGGNMAISGVIFGAYSLRVISGSNVTVVGTSNVGGGVATTAAVSAESDSHINFGASVTVISNSNVNARAIRVHNGSSVTCAPTTTLTSNAPFAIEINGGSWMDIHDANLIGTSGPTIPLSVTDNSKYTSNDLSVDTTTGQFAVYIAASSTAVVNSLSFTNVIPMSGFPVYIETESSFTSKTSLTITAPHQNTGMTVQTGSNVVVGGAFTSSSSSGGTGLILQSNSTMHCSSMVVNDNLLGNIRVLIGSSLTTNGDVQCSGLTAGGIGLLADTNSSVSIGGQLTLKNSTLGGAPTAVSITNRSDCVVADALSVSGNATALDIQGESKLVVGGVTTLSDTTVTVIRVQSGSELQFPSGNGITVPWAAGEANPINVMILNDSECRIEGDLNIAVASSGVSVSCDNSRLTVSGDLLFTNAASGAIGGIPVSTVNNSQLLCNGDLNLGTQYDATGFLLSKNSKATIIGTATLSNSSVSYGLFVRELSAFQCGILVASDNQLENILIQWDSSLSVTTLTASNSVTGSGVSVGANSVLTVAQSVVANGNAGSALALSEGSTCNVGTTVTAAGNLNTLSLDDHSRLSVQGATTLSDDAGTTVQAAGGSQAGFFAGLFLTWAAAETNPVTAVSMIGSECQISTTLNIEVASTGDTISCDNSKFTADAIAFLNVASGTIGGRPIFCTNNTQFLCLADLNAGAQFTGNGFELAKNSTATINGTTTLSGSGAGYGLYVRDASKIQTGAATVSDNSLNNIQIQQDSGMSVVGGDLTASGSVTGAGVSLNTNSTLTAGLNVGSDNNAQNAFVLRNASLVEVQGGVTCSGNTDTLLITQSSKMTVGSATLRDDPATIISLTSASFLTVIALLSIPWAAAESNPVRTISVAEGSDFYATTIAIETGTSLGDSIVCSDSNFEVSNTITFSNSAAGSIVGNVINCSQNSHFTCAGALNVGGEYTVNGLRVDGSSDVHIGGVATFNFVGAVNPNTGRGVFVTGVSNVSFGATLSVRNHDLWGVYVGTSSSVDIVGTIDVQGNGVGGALGSGGGIGLFGSSRFTSGGVSNAGVTNGPSLFYLNASEMSVANIAVSNVASVVTAVSGSKIKCDDVTSTVSTGVVISLLQSIMNAKNIISIDATGGPIILMTSSTLNAYTYTGSDVGGTNVNSEVYMTSSELLLGDYNGGVTLGTYTSNVTATSSRFYALNSNVYTQGFTITGGTSINCINLDSGTVAIIYGDVDIGSTYTTLGLNETFGCTFTCFGFTASGGTTAINLEDNSTFSGANVTLTGNSDAGLKMITGSSAVFNNLTMDDNATGVGSPSQISVRLSSRAIVKLALTVNSTGGLSKAGFEIDSSMLNAQTITVNDCTLRSIIQEGGRVTCDTLTMANNGTLVEQLQLINDSTLIVDGTLTINDTPNTCTNSLRILDGSKVTCANYTNGGATAASVADVYLAGRSELVISDEPSGPSTFTGTASPPTYLYMDTGSMFLCDVFLINNAGAAIAAPVIETSDGCQLNIEVSCDLGGNFDDKGIVMRGTTSSIRNVTADGGTVAIDIDAGTARFYGNTILNNQAISGISARRVSNVIFETDDIGPATFSSTTSRRAIECEKGSKMTFTSCNVTITDGTDFGILVTEGSALFMNGTTALNVGSTVGQTYQTCLFILSGSWVDLNIFATFGGATNYGIHVDDLSKLSSFRLLQGTIANGLYGLNMTNGAGVHVAQPNLSTVTGGLGAVFLGGQGVKSWANITAGGVTNRNDYSAAAPQNVAIS